MEATRKDKMEAEAKDRLEIAAQRFAKDEDATKRHLEERQDDCNALVMKVQERERATQVWVQSRVANMSDAQ